MMKHIRLIVLASIVLLALILGTITFTVDELKDIVLVKTFGQTTAVYRGSEPGGAGLKLKWIYPVQQEVRYDSRLHLIEDAYEQVQTRDDQQLLMQLFCAWKVSDAAKFNRTARTVMDAQAQLRTLLRSSKGDAVGRHPMQDFVNTDPDRMKIRQIEDEILNPMRQQASELFGIEVVMVGIKNINLPENVTRAVIESMKKERETKVQEYESRGKAIATGITSRAEAAGAEIIAFANRKAAEIRGEGYAASARHYKEFAENPELSAFLRWLESLKKELSSKSVLIIDPSVLPAVDWLQQGPTEASDVPTSPPGVGQSGSVKK